MKTRTAGLALFCRIPQNLPALGRHRFHRYASITPQANGFDSCTAHHRKTMLTFYATITCVVSDWLRSSRIVGRAEPPSSPRAPRRESDRVLGSLRGPALTPAPTALLPTTELSKNHGKRGPLSIRLRLIPRLPHFPLFLTRTGKNSGGIPVSERLFEGRATATPRFTDDPKMTGSDFDPILGTERPARAQRRPNGVQLLGRLLAPDLPAPAGPTFRLGATELFPLRERVQNGIGMPGAVAAVARPSILARISHHRRSHRISLEVPQNDEQEVAVQDDRGSEAALPDVAAGPVPPVVPPGVGDGQGLEDAADRLPGGRLEKQMEMVRHQAVAEDARKDTAPCPSGKAA